VYNGNLLPQFLFVLFSFTTGVIPVTLLRLSLSCYLPYYHGRKWRFHTGSCVNNNRRLWIQTVKDKPLLNVQNAVICYQLDAISPKYVLVLRTPG